MFILCKREKEKWGRGERDRVISFLTGPVFPRFLNINEMLPYAFNETGKGSSPKTGSID